MSLLPRRIALARAKTVTTFWLCGLLGFGGGTTAPLQAQQPAPWLPGSISATTYQPILPLFQLDPNSAGSEGTYNANVLTYAPGNPFFQALGTNGRTCATCHQPSDGMSITVSAVQSRYQNSHAEDPLFAPVDGANCPDAVKSPAFYAISDPNNPHSLLLNRALIRVGLP